MPTSSRYEKGKEGERVAAEYLSKRCLILDKLEYLPALAGVQILTVAGRS